MLLFLISFLLVAAVACATIAWREATALGQCDVRRVVRGRYRAATANVPRPDATLIEQLTSELPTTTVPPQRTHNGDVRLRARTATVDGAIAAGLAAGIGTADWLSVDPELLATFEQLTHTSIDNSLDLWGAALDGKLTTAGWEHNIRGHLGEHKVEAQLNKWAEGRVTMPDASNHPGYDVQVDGHTANVKVGADASAIRDHLAEHPNIPVIVNADMDGLPDDAVHVDLSAPFDTDLLAEHSVIVADGLLLSGLQDTMADAFGAALSSFGVDDVTDTAANLGVPVLGTAVRVVRSGMRENKLRAVHGDTARAMRNVGTDVALTGGGVAAGGALGIGLGVAIDALTMGATAGLGTTVIGPAIGAFLGGRKGTQKATEIRMRPLTDARSATSVAVKKYDQVASDAITDATQRWSDEVVPRAERQAAEVADTLRATAKHVKAHAVAEMARLEATADACLQDLLAQATTRVEVTELRLGHSLLVRRRIAAWRTVAANAARNAEFVLDVIAASPDGEAAVQTHLGWVAEQRAVALGAAGVAATRLQRRARLERLALDQRLRSDRADLARDAQRRVRPHAQRIERCTNSVRQELVATGAQSQEWVDKNFPLRQ